MSDASVGPTGHLSIFAPGNLGELGAGDDLAALMISALGPGALIDGDIVLVTSKVVAKAEGRVQVGDRDTAVDDALKAGGRVVARRGNTLIVRTTQGPTLAAAGVDASNVAAGHVVLLPIDADASARHLRAGLAGRSGVNVGVIVTDTAGRPWRVGQTDFALGAAGVAVLESYVGKSDGHGNELSVTAPAVADELAASSELVRTKLSGRPIAVIRGRPDLVLPPGEDGPGAQALVRVPAEDMFALGTREAVVAALKGDTAAFGEPAVPEDLVAALEALAVQSEWAADGSVHLHGIAEPERARLAVLAVAFGWRLVESPLRLAPAGPCGGAAGEAECGIG